MGKIALESDVYAIGGKGTPIAKKCCTKARAEALGAKIKSGYSYSSNQLIEEGSYYVSLGTATITGRFRNVPPDPSMPQINPGRAEYSIILAGFTPKTSVTAIIEVSWLCDKTSPVYRAIWVFRNVELSRSPTSASEEGPSRTSLSLLSSKIYDARVTSITDGYDLTLSY